MSTSLYFCARLPCPLVGGPGATLEKQEGEEAEALEWEPLDLTGRLRRGLATGYRLKHHAQRCPVMCGLASRGCSALHPNSSVCLHLIWIPSGGRTNVTCFLCSRQGNRGSLWGGTICSTLSRHGPIPGPAPAGLHCPRNLDFQVVLAVRQDRRGRPTCPSMDTKTRSWA